jgi:DNA-binding NarL/FixJ family response regulator
LVVTDIERAIRVVVADDHTLFRKGITKLLNDDSRLTVVGEAADAKEAIERVQSLRPDIVIMDVKLPKMNGIDAAREIAQRFPRVKVLFLTGLDSDNHVLDALASGASGYLLKDALPEAVISAVIAATYGSFIITAAVARRAFGALVSSSVRREAYDGISARELEVLKLTASGLANKQVARSLGLSEKTVRNHIANIYEKLGIHDRSQALLYAVRKGLVDPSSLENATPAA